MGIIRNTQGLLCRRDLAFYDTDDEVTRTVYSKNLEWVKNSRNEGV